MGGKGIFWKVRKYIIKSGILWEEGVDSDIRRHLA